MDFRRLRPWLLAASLVANGFLIGILVIGRPGHPPGGSPSRPEDIVEQMIDILPPADAEIFRQAAKEQGLTSRSLDDFADLHRRTSELMRAETFDAAAFNQLIGEFSAKREQAGDRISKTLMQALPKMSLQARRALADLPPPRPHVPSPKRNNVN